MMADTNNLSDFVAASRHLSECIAEIEKMIARQLAMALTTGLSDIERRSFLMTLGGAIAGFCVGRAVHPHDDVKAFLADDDGLLLQQIVEFAEIERQDSAIEQAEGGDRSDLDAALAEKED